MTHEISVTGDHAHMSYTRSLPWHGLGVAVPPNATPTDAARAAKLDWECRPIPLTLKSKVLGPLDTDTTALVRYDLWELGRGQDAILGTAPADYRPVQNAAVAEMLTDIMQSTCTHFETAGSLAHGKRNWFALNLNMRKDVAPADPVDMYLVLINRFDTRSIEARLTPVRVVCSNTMSLSARLGITKELQHSSIDSDSILIHIAQTLVRIRDRCSNLYALMVKMARTQITSSQLDALLRQTFPDEYEMIGGGPSDAVERARRIAKMLFEMGTGNDATAVAGTVWAAINGVTEFLDHRNEDPAEKLESIWFGDGYAAKMRAFNTALALCRGGASRTRTKTALERTSRSEASLRSKERTILPSTRAARAASSETRAAEHDRHLEAHRVRPEIRYSLDALDTEALWKLFQADPCEDNRNYLIEKFLHLVRFNAERIYQRFPDKVDIEDLMSAGLFGLMDAIDAYDLARGVKFETYCAPRIRGAILDELHSMGWVHRLGRHRWSKVEQANGH